MKPFRIKDVQVALLFTFFFMIQGCGKDQAGGVGANSGRSRPVTIEEQFLECVRQRTTKNPEELSFEEGVTIGIECAKQAPIK